MKFWQRLLVTVMVMVVASLLAGLIWQAIFNTGLPSYVSGAIGGLTALPVWEFIKRVGPKSGKLTHPSDPWLRLYRIIN